MICDKGYLLVREEERSDEGKGGGGNWSKSCAFVDIGHPESKPCTAEIIASFSITSNSSTSSEISANWLVANNANIGFVGESLVASAASLGISLCKNHSSIAVLVSGGNGAVGLIK
jgi:hypothetical protein